MEITQPAKKVSVLLPTNIYKKNSRFNYKLYIYILETITGSDQDKEYFGLHTAGFTGVAFQVCTTDATIYIKFVKCDIV